MDQPMGGKIALRQLGPLPDLDSVVFVRKQNRAFVTGQGPLATSASKTVRRFLRAGTWVFLIAGVVITLIVGAMEYFERAAAGGARRLTQDRRCPGRRLREHSHERSLFQLHGRGQDLSSLRAPDPRRHVRQQALAGDLCRRQSRCLGRGARQPAAALRGQYRRALDRHRALPLPAGGNLLALHLVPGAARRQGGAAGQGRRAARRRACAGQILCRR